MLHSAALRRHSDAFDTQGEHGRSWTMDLLLEAGGSGAMSVIEPDDVAAIAVKALMEDGHAGQTYKLTSEDAYTAGDLAALLSRVLRREIKAFVGDAEAFREALITKGERSGYPPAMARYFAKVAAGLYPTTDTAAKVLGRAPRAYADWLEQNLPAVYERS